MKQEPQENVEKDPNGQLSTDDSQAAQADMFDQIVNEALPEEDHSEKEDAEQVQDEQEDSTESEETVDDDVDDSDEDVESESDAPEDNVSIAELRRMNQEAQKHIGMLANRLGEATAALEKASQKPETPPAHVLLAESTPEEIESHLKLPDGVTGAQVKMFAQLMKSAFAHELKAYEPIKSEFSNQRASAEMAQRLEGKYKDLPQYATRVKNVLDKRYPTGLPFEQREKEIENIYLKLKKREKAEALAKGKNAQHREQVKSSSSAKASAPKVPKKQPDYWDDLNSGID